MVEMVEQGGFVGKFVSLVDWVQKMVVSQFIGIEKGKLLVLLVDNRQNWWNWQKQSGECCKIGKVGEN